MKRLPLSLMTELDRRRVLKSWVMERIVGCDLMSKLLPCMHCTCVEIQRVVLFNKCSAR